MTNQVDDTGRIEAVARWVGPTNFSTKRILTFGDSITRGVGETVGCGYRALLSNQLMADGGFTGIQWVGTLQGGVACQLCPDNGYAMFHDGLDGYTNDNLNTIAPTIIPVVLPDVILLHAGTNDGIAFVGGTETLAAAMANFDTLMATCRSLAPKAMIFAAQLVPSPNLSTFLPTYNAHVVSEVAALNAAGDQTFIVDCYTALNPATDFDPGGVHPNTAGYTKMAPAWYTGMTAPTA